MSKVRDPLDRLARLLAPSGLIVRGGFHPLPGDGVADGTGTVVLIGNAGGAMWRAFAAGRPDGPDPLDRWLAPRIAAAAEAVGARVVLPNAGPPWVPIQDWAARAEPVHRSPVGIMIHPEYGLWHVYRAALLFAERLDLPPRADAPSPCEGCAAKPCLEACPVDAFEPARFAAERCVPHVESAAGRPCRERGCMARRACPVGARYRYPPEAQAFHTEAFLAAGRRHLAR